MRAGHRPGKARIDFDLLQDATKLFSVVLFIQEADLAEHRREIEELGKRANLRLVVQPCPYEGIEFLHRVGHDLIAHHTGLDVKSFWQALAFRPDTPAELLGEISEHHHGYLCAILEQDAAKVERQGRALESFTKRFA